MSVGRFVAVIAPGDVRPTVHVVDMAREVAEVVFTSHGEGALARCEYLAAELSESDAEDVLPPVFDLPGSDTPEPF